MEKIIGSSVDIRHFRKQFQILTDVPVDITQAYKIIKHLNIQKNICRLGGYTRDCRGSIRVRGWIITNYPDGNLTISGTITTNLSCNANISRNKLTLSSDIGCSGIGYIPNIKTNSIQSTSNTLSLDYTNPITGSTINIGNNSSMGGSNTIHIETLIDFVYINGVLFNPFQTSTQFWNQLDF